MPRSYVQIDLVERRLIAKLHQQNLTVSEIAKAVGRHRSTVCRELRRNRFTDSDMPVLNGYYCVSADVYAKERRIRQGKLIQHRELRDAVVDDRNQFGHWEGDLVMFRREYGKANITTLVERKTRYTALFRNNDRQSKPIMHQVVEGFSSLPQNARRSFTFDSRATPTVDTLPVSRTSVWPWSTV